MRLASPKKDKGEINMPVRDDLGTRMKDFYETVEANLEKISKGINLL